MQYPYPAKDMASLVPRERWDQNAPVLPLTDRVLEMAEAENGDTLTRSPEFFWQIEVTWSEFLRVPICTPGYPSGTALSMFWLWYGGESIDRAFVNIKQFDGWLL